MNKNLREAEDRMILDLYGKEILNEIKKMPDNKESKNYSNSIPNKKRFEIDKEKNNKK